MFRLFQVTGNGKKNNSTSENIFSWVHKEFKENDINATKHRLLCKLDDMSHGKFNQIFILNDSTFKDTHYRLLFLHRNF